MLVTPSPNNILFVKPFFLLLMILFIHLSIHPYVYPSINPSIYPSIHSSIHLSIHPHLLFVVSTSWFKPASLLSLKYMFTYMPHPLIDWAPPPQDNTNFSIIRMWHENVYIDSTKWKSIIGMARTSWGTKNNTLIN